MKYPVTRPRMPVETPMARVEGSGEDIDKWEDGEGEGMFMYGFGIKTRESVLTEKNGLAFWKVEG